MISVGFTSRIVKCVHLTLWLDGVAHINEQFALCS